MRRYYAVTSGGMLGATYSGPYWTRRGARRAADRQAWARGQKTPADPILLRHKVAAIALVVGVIVGILAIPTHHTTPVANLDAAVVHQVAGNAGRDYSEPATAAVCPSVPSPGRNVTCAVTGPNFRALAVVTILGGNPDVIHLYPVAS